MFIDKEKSIRKYSYVIFIKILFIQIRMIIGLMQIITTSILHTHTKFHFILNDFAPALGCD